MEPKITNYSKIIHKLLRRNMIIRKINNKIYKDKVLRIHHKLITYLILVGRWILQVRVMQMRSIDQHHKLATIAIRIFKSKHLWQMVLKTYK